MQFDTKNVHGVAFNKDMITKANSVDVTFK